MQNDIAVIYTTIKFTFVPHTWCSVESHAPGYCQEEIKDF